MSPACRSPLISPPGVITAPSHSQQYKAGAPRSLTCRGHFADVRMEIGMLQRQATIAEDIGEVPPIVYDVLRSQGKPLDTGVRTFMESRFRADFSSVRIHTDAIAARSAAAVNAKAYTVGRHVAFAEGRYSPGSAAGRSLLAHELTHVMQQRTYGTSSSGLIVAGAYTAAERDASTMADQTMSSASGIQVQAARSGLAREARHHDVTEPVTSMTTMHAHACASSTPALCLQRQPSEPTPSTACRNSDDIERTRSGYAGRYGPSVAVYPHQIVAGDTLYALARATKTDNNVHVIGHYDAELARLNTDINTSRIGNCALLLRGWTDPAIGRLPTIGVGPGTGVIPADVRDAVATIYSEQTGTSANAREQQKYIWFSIRTRLQLGMHGPALSDVLREGGYFGRGTPDYQEATRDLNRSLPTLAAVVQILNMVQATYMSPIPHDAGPYYFHWRRRGTPESCYQRDHTRRPSDAKERQCARTFAIDRFGPKGLHPDLSWLRRLPGDTAAPDERIGSMYVYPY